MYKIEHRPQVRSTLSRRLRVVLSLHACLHARPLSMHKPMCMPLHMPMRVPLHMSMHIFHTHLSAGDLVVSSGGTVQQT